MPPIPSMVVTANHPENIREINTHWLNNDKSFEFEDGT
jgi:hypothetical protein